MVFNTRSTILITATVLTVANALNDWSKPCLKGVCHYDIPDDGDLSSGSLKIWGSNPDAIADITTAAHWEIIGCDKGKQQQDIRIVCKDEESTHCPHLYKTGSAEGKVVRLPEECGKNAFARVARSWDPEDQSIPSHIAARLVRRSGVPPKVRALALDTDFAAVDHTKYGTINFAIQGANVPGAKGDFPSTNAKRQLLERGLFGDIGDAIGDVAGDVVDGAKDVGKTVVKGAETAGKAVVNGAETAGKAVLNGAETAGKAVVNGTEKAVKAVGNGAEKAGKAVVDGAEKAGKTVVDGAEKAGKTVVDGAEKAGKAVVNGAEKAGKTVVDGAEKAGKATVNAVSDGLDAVGDGTKKATKFVGDVAKKLNNLDLDKTVKLPPLEVNKDFKLLDQKVECEGRSAGVSITLENKAHFEVTLGIVAAGTLVPPNIEDIAVTSTITGDLDSAIDFKAEVSGTLDSGKKQIFEIGVPGLDFPGILTIGPSFRVDVQAIATLELNVDLNVGVNYHIDRVQLVFPPRDDQKGGGFNIGQTPLKLAASPSVAAKGSVEAHIIPSINLGISAIGGKAKADVFLNLDASAKAELTLEAKAEVDATIKKGGKRELPSSLLPARRSQRHNRMFLEERATTTTRDRDDEKTTTKEEEEKETKTTSTKRAETETAATTSVSKKSTSSSSASSSRKVSSTSSSSVSKVSSTRSSVSSTLTSLKSKTKTRTTTASGSSSSGSASAKSRGLSSSASGTASSASPSASSNGTSVDVATKAGFGGCFNVGAELAVNAGAEGSFFGLFDDNKTFSLFKKDFELFKKCFGNQKRDIEWPSAHDSLHHSRSALNRHRRMSKKSQVLRGLLGHQIEKRALGCPKAGVEAAEAVTQSANAAR